MLKEISIAAALATFSTAALADHHKEGKSFEDIDTDGNGELSLTEVQSVKPKVTQNDFDSYDEDGSGGISMAEYEAWKKEKKMKDKDEDGGY